MFLLIYNYLHIHVCTVYMIVHMSTCNIHAQHFVTKTQNMALY